MFQSDATIAVSLNTVVTAFAGIVGSIAIWGIRRIVNSIDALTVAVSALQERMTKVETTLTVERGSI